MRKYLIALFTFLSITFLNAQVKQAVYNVRDFGAKGDGITNDQTAIQKAIDACKKNGGTVVLEKGTFLTGQIVLVSNLILKIDASATIIGIKSDAEKDYPHHLIETKYPNRMLQDCQRRLLYGNKVQNVTITGGGTINGQGDYELWMHVKEIGTEKDRPSILAFVGCNTITVSNISLVKPACWTQVYIESDNISIQKIKVNTGQLTPNRDGIDIVDCHNVLIEDSHIESEDDGICFKSGSEFGCKDIIVRRCTLDKLNVKAGNCFKLGTDGLGSFMNFDVSELMLQNAYQNSAFCIESMDGAVIDNLNFRDCLISNCGQAIFILLADRKRTVPNRQTRIGTISNIQFKNIVGTDFTQQYPSIITGIKGHNIQNVTLENLNFELKGGIQTNDQTVMEYDGKYPEGSYFGNTNAFGFFIRHTDTVTFKNCKITTKLPDKRPWLVHEDTKNVFELN
ncbi:exo-poly-alpha-D-galacturonosidase [Flavobacterium palustre]|uniref:Exo-poly-alpha-D-galacturonosidase n=1 Tax=Flavobacterium palustre TaxID=1476463 RepID=A0ABQ1HGG8_9FLAO|nr:glycosyl hydrolase family 28 protein [Flavobacterium palustre]GGA76608.1 exo-poly-alpha-D-galacturonosidase [Flavobacterium palustre]